MADAYLRIGEVARRSGVSAELLRVWERRYGVLQPERSAGGFRLYSEQDVERVSEMRRLVAEGVSAGGGRAPRRRGRDNDAARAA